MIVRISSAAERDLADGAAFYERQALGLGAHFLRHLSADIDMHEVNAGIHHRNGRYFRVISRYFPYAIYYELEGAEVVVWAVIDMRQHPERIAERLN